MKSRFFILAMGIAYVSGAILIAGCSSATKRKWLTTFFDGVPPPNSETNLVASAPSAESGGPPVETAPAPVVPVSTYFGHPPFVDQKCAECHEPGIGQGMKKKMPELCFACHKDFLATAKIKHQPAESGECISCHDPHQSEKNKHLLLKTGKELCFDCHDDFLAKAKVKHQPAENGECLACHNPHATDRKKLVTKSTPVLCWDCHDNFLEKAKFQHDVVEDCTSCHNPHQSGESKLLSKNVSKLCFDCHEEKDLQKVSAHANTEGKSCVACHDPHVGSNKFLLKNVKAPDPAK